MASWLGLGSPKYRSLDLGVLKVDQDQDGHGQHGHGVIFLRLAVCGGIVFLKVAINKGPGPRFSENHLQVFEKKCVILVLAN